MINPIKVVIGLAIAIALLGPFLLTEYVDIEPYPAVLQPAGAYTISTADRLLTFDQTQLIAVKPDGSEIEVDTEAFMGAIPHHFWRNIAERDFGLQGAPSKSFSLGVWTLSATQQAEVSPKARQAAVSWIQSRLSEQGISGANALVVRRMKRSFDVEAGTESKREITEQIDVDIS